MAGKANRTNGKGDQPRKVNGPKYRDNYDNIKWNKDNELRTEKRINGGEDCPAVRQTPLPEHNEH